MEKSQSTEQSEKISVPFPAEWGRSAVSSVWVSAFGSLLEMANDFDDRLLDRHWVFDDVVLGFQRGAFEYKQPTMRVRQVSRQIEVTLESFTTPQGVIAVFCTPHAVDEEVRDEPSIIDSIDTARGLANLAGFDGIATDPLFNAIFAVDVNTETWVGPTTKNPDALLRSFSGAEAMATMEVYFAAVRDLPESKRSVAETAVHWQLSSRGESGHDEFVRVWIAIEALSGANGDRVVIAIESMLSDAYGFNRDQTRAMFQTGRLFGLRSKIVHQGVRVALHANLSGFLNAMFEDLFRYYVGLPSARKAETYLSHPLFEEGPLDIEALCES